MAAAWGLVCGAGLTHHATSVLVSGPLSLVLLIVLIRSRSLRPSNLTVAITAALVPLASYALLLVKAQHPGPAVWAALEPSWASVIAHATGAQYRGFLGHFRPLGPERQSLGSDIYPFLLVGGAALVVLALRAPDREERLIALGIGGAVAAQLLFVFGYGVPDPASYFLPAVALSLCALAPLGAGLITANPRSGRLALVSGVAMALCAALLSWSWGSEAALRRKGLESVERRYRDTWATVPFDRGLVLWGSDLLYRLQLYRVLNHEKPGVELVNPVGFTSDVTRRRFVAQFGYDPMAGVTLPASFLSNPVAAGPDYARFMIEVGRRLEAGTRLPVAIFDPRHRIVVPLDRYPVRDSVSTGP